MKQQRSFPQSHFAEDLTGEQVTISLDVLVDVDRIVNIDGREFNVKGNRWTRIYVTKEFAENSTKNVRIRNPFSKKISRDKVDRVNLIDSLSTDINIIYYRNLQVQKGNVATRWTQTPEELEGNIKRASTQINQLVDSISLMVTKNEFSSEILQHAESVVTAINSTDGVGRLKTTKVTVDGNGLAVDDGALIIRDSNNTAIITSDGLKMKYVYSSSGPILGWSKMGIAEGPGGYFPMECLLLAYIPDELKITRAYLHVESMPSHLTNDPNGNPNGTYHPRSMRINKVIDTSDGLIWVDGYGIADQPTYNGRVDITSSTWGSNWSPAGLKIATKSTDIANHLDIGRNVFILDTTVTPNLANRRYFGLVKMELEVEGYLRG